MQFIICNNMLERETEIKLRDFIFNMPKLDVICTEVCIRLFCKIIIYQ